MSNKIIAIILAYNCQHEIIKTLKKIQKFEKYFFKICIIDNNSRDKTFNKANNFIKSRNLKKFEIISNLKNFGQGGSHKAAFEYTLRYNCDYCLIYHGDDQANIFDFKKVFSNKIYKNYDAVLGARFLNGSKLINYQFYRIFGNKFFNLLFSVVSNYKIYDLGSGINLYGRKIISEKNVKYIDNEMGFNYQNLLLMITRGRNLKFLPISWKSEGEESNVQLVSQSLKVLKIVIFFFLKKDYFSFLKYRCSYNETPKSKIFSTRGTRAINWKFRL